LTCRFCQQWNTEVATRCCFCGNLLSATEDATTGGRSSAAFKGLAQLPGEPKAPQLRMGPAPRGEPELERHGQLLDKAGLVIGIIIAIAFGLYVLIRIKYRF
jgi:hypothetical protein